MTVLKDALDKLPIPGGISSRWPGFSLKWVEQTAGFDIFDLTDRRGGKLAIGDDADYLHLFMIMSDYVYQADSDFKTLLLASDANGNRLFARYYTEEEKNDFKYAYVALDDAAKELPESAINGKFTFFAEVSLEKAASDGFEKEARKAARFMSADIKQAWEALAEKKSDFLKADLYAFQLLKLYSWGFTTINRDDDAPHDYHFVRERRPQPRGTSRR